MELMSSSQHSPADMLLLIPRGWGKRGHLAIGVGCVTWEWELGRIYDPENVREDGHFLVKVHRWGIYCHNSLLTSLCLVAWA